jgi:squalene synthase HpnC
MDYKNLNILELLKPDGGVYKAGSVDEAYDFCKSVTKAHYENFPVGSFIIPKKLRKHFYSIYSFARVADDFGDELSAIGKDKQLESLTEFEKLLYDESFKSSNSGNPVFLALHNTMTEKDIPREPFSKLITAFKRDVCFEQPKNFAELEDYCSYSANPVGELVLRLFGLYNKETENYSDSICTGLQLVNFWQDLSGDLRIGRLYIPFELLDKYGLNKDNLHDEKNSVIFNTCLDELYNITETYFLFGYGLIKFLGNKRLRFEITATVEGGLKILNKLRRNGIRVLTYRPRLNRVDYINIFFKIVTNKRKLN